MTQTQLAWYSALNYFTPIIYNGIKRGDRVTTNYLRMPRVKLYLGQRTPMNKFQSDNLMGIIRELAPHYFNDKEIYNQIKDHKIMIRENGTRYSIFTILGYIQKVRKEPGMRPEDINSQSYQIKELYNKGKSAKEICSITGARIDWVKKVIKKIAK